MKITAFKHLHAGAGWRNVSFLKLMTEEGIIGWAEFREGAGNLGLGAVIEALGQLLIGRDPREVEANVGLLKARTFQTAGGLNQQAIASLVNAMIDVKAKALGIPVSALFGGQVRARIPLYWSHCATYRVRHYDDVGAPRVKNFDDIAELGAEVRSRGFKALKTSVLGMKDGQFTNFGPGFAWSDGWPGLELDRSFIKLVEQQLRAFRAGAGEDVDLMIDLNCHFKPEGFLQLAHALDSLGLKWVEMDIRDARALAQIRRAIKTPVASCEALYGKEELKPFLEQGSMSTAIVDVCWNGYLEAYKMAVLADAYAVNVATHAYGGSLAEMMSAQWASAVPNLAIMEYDVDDVPWKNDLVTHPPVIENGQWLMSDRPGWGSDVNEAAVAKHPPV